MNVYQQNGYDNREHYLECLAEDFEVPSHVVYMIADLLGENEDFDGLVTSLEDYQNEF
jgi:hypothetical protein